ncbi:Tigger transposable element-derived protein 1-like 158, partial [Homarus americanus]
GRKIKEMAGSATPLTATKVTRFCDAEMESMERMLSTWIDDQTQRKPKKNISNSWEAITQQNMNSVWRKLWPECVHNFVSFPSVPAVRKTILTLVKKAGFDEVDDTDVEDLLDSHNEELTNEDLIELLNVQNLRKLISSFEMAIWH